ncbi:MAG: two-component system, LuxR family, sensor kinase FixL [Verrucomicrobiota bacterium]|jgi:signal transduction histidine kinase
MLLRIVEFLQRQPRGVIFFEALGLLVLITCVDFETGHQTSVVLFYVAPILLAAFCCNNLGAMLLALLATAACLAADTLDGFHYSSLGIHTWEIGIRSLFFFCVAIVGYSVKKRGVAANTRISLLEHTQRLEHQIVEVSEYEQKRIGQDLHDGLCQYLAALGCSAESLKSDLEKSGLPKFAAVAGDLAQLLRAGVSQTRNLAHGLMPVHMDECGLASALDELTSSSSRLLGIECVLSRTGDTPAGDKTKARHLYRIAQEAINNATKHGNAQRIDISLTSNPTATVLSIADDGVGISKTTKNLHGMGLSIMRYRSNSMGGELLIEERPTGGTVISCIVREGHGQEELNVTTV